MFAEVADKPSSTNGFAFTSRKTLEHRGPDVRSSIAGLPGCVKQARRLNMANNPKKVKDPTEVALSAIQEALNISDGASGDSARSSGHSDAAPANASSISTPAYNESAFDTRPSEDRQIFEPTEEPPPTSRAANDDRETIGQILQAIQKGRPTRNVYTLATIFAGVWLVGAGLLTISFLPSLQAAIGQGTGGTLVLAGLAGVFRSPGLLLFFLAGV